MCGICGLYAPGSIEPALIERMRDTLVHRGPDDHGLYIDERVGLGSRRLSIIDLASGQMPIANEDGTVWVIQNGEIYNFQELRAELLERGHRFTTHTDTEVIVHLYEEVGEKVFSRLRGMFAIALWDRRQAILLLGRDRVGKKPLYYSWDGRRLAFGSEIKALRPVPWLRPSLDLDALNDYFSYLYIPDPRSIFREIRKLPAGHYLRLEGDSMTLHEYWDLDFQSPHRETEPEFYLERLRELLTDAVRCRLVSDVPLGAFLSGGIDSATVVGIMSQLSSKPVRTFSIGFDAETHDELRFARIAARAFGTDHHEEVLQPRAAELIEQLVHHFDEPFGDPSALPTFMVSRMARRYVTVALSGDGGDEAFAGYQHHTIHIRDENFNRRVPAPLRRAARDALASAARATRNAKLARVAGAVGRADQPLAMRFANIFTKGARQQLFSAAVRAQLGTPREEALYERLLAAQRFPNFLSSLLYADTKAMMNGDFLVKVDRASMANSLEVRAPLVDHQLLEFAATIPSSLKLHKGVSKYIFKKCVETFVPREIVYREKHGFGVPIRAWFRDELHDMLHDQLLDQRDPGNAYFDRRFIERLLQQHTAGRRDWSPQLWALLVFRLWHRKWVG
jgi:asparagine synthase (glutamine-hydrolysing)